MPRSTPTEFPHSVESASSLYPGNCRSNVSSSRSIACSTGSPRLAESVRAGLWQRFAMASYLDENRASWDDRAPAHAASPDYAFERFAADPDFLSEVVRFDLPLLGDISGARGVHLQCHIGTDTISLARLGAVMTGLDFSGASVAEAQATLGAGRHAGRLRAIRTSTTPSTSCTPRTSTSSTRESARCAGCPTIRRWAQVVSGLLRPGGRLFIREGHPMLWSLDEARTADLVVGYPYFETQEPLTDEDPGTYVATDATFTQNVSHSWNHGLGEIVTALLDAGMRADRPGRARQRAVGGLAGSHGERRARRMAPRGSTVATRVLVHAAGGEALGDRDLETKL